MIRDDDIPVKFQARCESNMDAAVDAVGDKNALMKVIEKAMQFFFMEHRIATAPTVLDHTYSIKHHLLLWKGDP